MALVGPDDSVIDGELVSAAGEPVNTWNCRVTGERSRGMAAGGKPVDLRDLKAADCTRVIVDQV
jgi:hypothetical protein